MNLTTFKVPGTDAVRLLGEYRSRFRTTGQYPFLIGDSEELERITEMAGCNDQDPAAIIHASFDITRADWIAGRRREAEEYKFSADEILGEWPDEILKTREIGIHKNVMDGKIKPEVYLGSERVNSFETPAVRI